MPTFKQYALLGLSCLAFISCSPSTEMDTSQDDVSQVIPEDHGSGAVENLSAAKDRVAAQPSSGAVAAKPQNAVLPVLPTPGVQSPQKPFSPQSPGISVSRVSVPNKLVALTFDDGPHPSLTPRLLDILARTGAKATFFMLGQNVSRYPDIVRRADAEGHEVASHSYSHPNLNKCSLSKVYQELDSTEAAIQKATGKKPALVRPPYGNMKKDVRALVNRKYGYHVVLWDVDPLDWRRPGSGVVAQRLVKGSRPGSILLSHDIHEGTVNAMESAIRSLQSQGYRFVTVSELIAEGQTAARSQTAHPAAPQIISGPGETPEAVLPATASNN